MGVLALNSLSQFLSDYPGMSTAPYSDAGVCLRGKFRFKADVKGGNEVEDFYKLEIVIPHKYPLALPRVKEIGGKIPRDGNFHINPDGTLCLGSPLRLLKKIYSATDFNVFIDKCLVPYLYAVSYKLMHGGKFVFGELAHGDQGIVDDYSDMLGLQERHQIAQSLRLLGMKKRIANKKTCPCGCGKRLGACSFHHKLNAFRDMAPMSWFRAHAMDLEAQI
ncbi:hypothetical protein [Desulfuromonas acetoxidans]|uniref:hypothetical protein n=1 Tax=Desulfuromonas acetoxidans TaxID=891 RepID=UPI00292F8BE0|nr:hypothetical protein [Desulfuromonas acetoxidans]